MPKPPTKRGTATRGGKRTSMSVAPPAPVPGTTRGFPMTSPPVDTTSPAAKAANSRAALFGQVSYTAGPTLTRYSTYPADGISAEIIKSAFKTADLGYPLTQADLYEQVVERDAHLKGVAKARIFEVSGKPWRLSPRDETPVAAAVAKFVRATLDEIDAFDADINDLLWANGNGYASSEIVWRFDSLRFQLEGKQSATVTALVPGSLEWVHPKHFQFDQITDEPLLVLGSGRISLPPNKFIFHGAADTGFYERRGYMRAAVPLHAMKAWTMRDWLLYEALFANPQITGTYPNDKEEYEAQRSVYQQIMRDWGKSIPAFLPDDIDFKITAAQSGGTSSGVHAAICGFVNQELSKLIQGETLTTEVGNVGAYAATETHADVRYAFIRSDANQLAQTIRDQLLRPIVYLNAELLARVVGVSPAEICRCVPSIQWRIDRETSPTQRVDNLIKLANAGVPIGLDQVCDEAAIDPPREGAKLLRGDAITLADGTATIGAQEASEGADNPKADEDAVSGNAEGASQMPQSQAPRVDLTATDIATIVTVNEARASQGLPPMAGEDGDLTVAEFKAKNAGPIAEAAQAEAGHDPDDEPEPPPPTGMRRFDAGNFKEADHPRKGGKFAPKGGGDGGAKAKPTKPASAPKGDTGGSGKGAASAAKRNPHRPDDGTIEWAIESAVRNHFFPDGTDADKAEAPIDGAKDAPAKPAKPAKVRPFKLKAQRAPRAKPPADPNAPAKAPRIYHRDHLGRFRVAPQPGDNAAQLTLPTKLPTVRKDGKVKVDPSKVPGGGQHFKVRTTNNPEAGYKGRSFVMNSVADGLAEFMATPCAAPDIEGYQGDKRDGWTNGDVLQAVMGKGYGDATIWKEIASATDGKVTDLESGFKALATPRKTGRGVRDWRDFNIEAFQSAHPAFAVLSRPAWLDDHANDQQVATYYQEQAESAKAYKPEADSDADADGLPYYGGAETYQSYDDSGEASHVPF